MKPLPSVQRGLQTPIHQQSACDVLVACLPYCQRSGARCLVALLVEETCRLPLSTWWFLLWRLAIVHMLNSRMQNELKKTASIIKGRFRMRDPAFFSFALLTSVFNQNQKKKSRYHIQPTFGCQIGVSGIPTASALACRRCSL